MARFNLTFTVDFLNDKIDANSFGQEMEHFLNDRFRNKNIKFTEMSVNTDNN